MTSHGRVLLGRMSLAEWPCRFGQRIYVLYIIVKKHGTPLVGVIGRIPRGRVSHGRASLHGCHWLDGRVVLAKEYIYYIVKPTWHSPCGAHL